MLPNSFGVYKIEKCLGKGAMGVVWRAFDTRLERRVALKVLPEDLASDSNRRKRFLREARAASSLSHPNVITIYEVDSALGVDFIVMELVEGLTLSEMLAKGPLERGLAVRIAIGIARGLSCAHRAGVIHRDLKPGNIMFSEMQGVKILDFGLAAIAGGAKTQEDDTKTQLTVAGAAIGTFGYMPPEQALGEAASPASDVFSFGVVLYEMLTGRMPFEGSTRSQQTRSMLQRDAVDIQKIGERIPAHLANIVMRCLEREPDQRFKDATELLAALEASPSTGSGKKRQLLLLSVAIAAALLFALMLLPRLGTVASPFVAADRLVAARESLIRYDLPSHIENAIEQANLIISSNPNSAPAHQILAQAYLFKNYAAKDQFLVKQSAQFARKAIELDEYLASAHLVLGAALVASGDLPAAEAPLRRGRILDPKNPLGALFQAQWHAANRRLADADLEFRKAQSMAPGLWFLWSQSGSFHYRNGEFEKAARDFEKAAAVAPNNTRILANLSTSLHMLDRNEEAAAAIQRALEIEPSDILYTNLGTLRFYEGRYADALPAMQKAVDLGAMDYANWANLGDTLRWIPGRRPESKEAYGTAIRLLNSNLKQNPAEPNLNTMLLSLYAKNGQIKEAKLGLDSLKLNVANQAFPLYRLALAREILGQRDVAIQLLSKSIQAGYSIRELNNDPELAALRMDPRFQQALTEASLIRK